MKKYTKSKRSFITGLEAGSYIKYVVGFEPERKGKHWKTNKPVTLPATWWSDITLTDCYRSISWDFSGKTAQKKLNKARSLMNEFFDLTQKAINDTKAASNKRTRK